MGKQEEIPEKLLFLELESNIKKIRERFNTLLKKHESNVTFDQWLVLKEIAVNQGANQKCIATKLAKEVASISRMLTKLSLKKLILKKSNTYNMREFKLYLSPDGFELIDKIDKSIKKEFETIFSGIYEQELNLVSRIFSRINADLK